LSLKPYLKDLNMKNFYKNDVPINKSRTEAKRNNNYKTKQESGKPKKKNYN
jgi:hypothetical protein